MTATEWAPARPVKTSLPPAAYRDEPRPVATFLGLFSVGLGLAELCAPRALADLTGVRYPGLLRAYGLREVAAGVGLLTARRPAGWLWARVAGDVLDLATAGAAYAQAAGDDRRKAVRTVAALAGVAVLDFACAREHTRNPG